jgi:hypothetical protein
MGVAASVSPFLRRQRLFVVTLVLSAGNLYSAYLAYVAAHHGAEAAAEFQKILDHRGLVICDPVGALAHLQLGRAYALSVMTPRQDRPIRTSLRCGTTPTPTSLSSSSPKPSMQSCNRCVAPLWKLGVGRTPNETVQKSTDLKPGHELVRP